MPMPSHTMTQTSSLISTCIDAPPIDEIRDEFNEDIVISLGYYCYRKYDKSVVKRGKKRSKDESDADTYLSNEIVWTQQFGDPHVDATDAASILGAFTGANFDVLTTLNRQFDK